MKRVAAFFSSLIVIVLLNTSASIAQASLIDQSEEISCRFLGLENFFNDVEIISLHILGNISEIRVDDEKKDIPVRKITSEGLESLKRSIRQNLPTFENGKNSYFDTNAAAKFLEIERPYYQKVLDKAHSVTTYEFGKQDWYFELEKVYNFYDERGNYLTSWGFSRFAGVFNFCIPTS